VPVKTGSRAALDGVVARVNRACIKHTPVVLLQQGAAVVVPAPTDTSSDCADLKGRAMTAPNASPAHLPPALYLDSPHRHTRRCFWDYLECRWQCPPAAGTSDPTARAQEVDSPTEA
jgi:hypothetical protein